MSTLLNSHAQHGAYLKVDGKPVVFFYNQDARLSTGGWAAIRSRGGPWIGTAYGLRRALDVSPLTVFDGHHLYCCDLG